MKPSEGGERIGRTQENKTKKLTSPPIERQMTEEWVCNVLALGKLAYRFLCVSFLISPYWDFIYR